MAHDEHGINVMKMTIPPKTVYRLKQIECIPDQNTHNILQR